MFSKHLPVRHFLQYSSSFVCHLFSLLFFHSSSNRSWYTTLAFTVRYRYHQTHLLVVGSLPQLIHLNLFSLACVINIRFLSNLNHNGTLSSLQSLPLDHLLVVGNLELLIHLNRFSLACAISSHKMVFVGLEPQWYITQPVALQYLPLDHLLVVGNLELLIHLNRFSLVCAIINSPHISSHKMIFVGLEPQWYNTQRVVFTTRTLACCCNPSATYSLYPFFSSLCN